MESDSPSSPTSPKQRSRQASRCSSTTIGSSTTSGSSELPELDHPHDSGSADQVKIAGIDEAFDELDIGKASEHDSVPGQQGRKDSPPTNQVGTVGTVEGDEEEGSEETLNEAGQDDGDEVDEDHPLYQYTLALFEYTKRQYLEARWQHEKLERDQNRRQQRSKKSGMQMMAARKAAMSNNLDHGI